MTLEQRQITAARMLASGVRTKVIAEQLGVARETISRWKNNPDFMEIFQTQQQELMDRVMGQIMAGAVVSVDLLNVVVKTNEIDVKVRVDAAKKIVDASFKTFEFAVIKRKIEEIDEYIARNPDGTQRQFVYPETPEHVKDLWKVQSQQLEIEQMLLRSEMAEKEKERIRQLLAKVGDATSYVKEFGTPMPVQEPTFESDVEIIDDEEDLQEPEQLKVYGDDQPGLINWVSTEVFVDDD